MSKILVSVDDKLLTKIDRAAKAAGLSRSGYLARLAERDLGMERGPGATREVRQAIKNLQKLFAENPPPEDATAAIRAERDFR
jgi:metal-responsive CopG/Arc/MetJ family transcriptional regulator